MRSFIFAAVLLNVLTLTLGADEAKKYVDYEQFGAKGNGKSDDTAALVAAHAYANKHNLPVRVKNSGRYYIGGKKSPIIIMTDTDFGKAQFTIDDRNVQNRSTPVFMVRSKLRNLKKLPGVTELAANQKQLPCQLPARSLVLVKDSSVMRYIRWGVNANNGLPQTDVFIVNKDGSIDKSTPVLWDFKQFDRVRVMPIDARTLTIRGGIFTTLTNHEAGQHKYFNRGINILRSNVLVEGLVHRVIEPDADESFPYSGFITIKECADVTVKNCVLTGRKRYYMKNPKKLAKSTGTYDISVTAAVNVKFINCSQTNDITDPAYWGIMGSNYCKNLLLDNCRFSRFDAHMGVCNAVLRNSTLGHQGVNAIGFGTLLMENCIVKSRYLINMRIDYGSTWRGKFIIRNCTFEPPERARRNSVALIGGRNDGSHDFGYTCYMPEVIDIDGLLVKDRQYGKLGKKYRGPFLLADFNNKYRSGSYREKYPYIKPRSILVRNFRSESGKPCLLSRNKYMFKNVKLIRKP